MILISKYPRRIFNAFLLAAAFTSLHSCKETPAKQAEEQAEREAYIGDDVSLTAAQLRAAGIQTDTLVRKDLGNTIKVSGKLEVPAQNKAAITSLYPGLLQTLLVHPGSEVRKGQIIATIANTELAGVQQNLISVHAQLKLAELELKRQQELVAGNAAPAKRLQQAEAALHSLEAQQTALQQQLSAAGASSSFNKGNISSVLTLRAPISGTISDIHAQIGSRVDAATPVAAVVNNTQLHLDLFVYEKDLPQVRKGQRIHFTLTNNPGREYDALIFSIGSAFAGDMHAVPVHADVQGDKTGLIEGMSATAIISVGTTLTAAVPAEAIVSTEGNDYIFVSSKQLQQNQPFVFKRIQVVRGITDLGYTAINPVKALPPDAKIVVKGAFFLMAVMTNKGEE